MTPAEELLNDVASQIYEPPLSGRRETASMRDLADPLTVVMLVIDFVTEVEMNGIFNFLGNSTGRFASETAEVLRVIGCSEDAAALAQIVEVASATDMNHERIQDEMSQLEPYAITSWRSLHGQKWQSAEDAISSLAEKIDDGRIREALERFAERTYEALKAVLTAASSP